MELKTKIEADLKTALLARKSEESTALRGLKAAILSTEIEKKKRETGLTDAEIEEVVAKEIKKRRESVDVYEANGRGDLAVLEKDEIKIFSRYLPEQMSESEIVEKIDEVLASLNEGEVKNMGIVMGRVKAIVGSKADMGTVSRLVKEKIGN
jgi:uncharacterized protein YqeY